MHTIDMYKTYVYIYMYKLYSAYIDTTQSGRFNPSLNQRCWQHRDSQPVHDPYCCTNHWSCDENQDLSHERVVAYNGDPHHGILFQIQKILGEKLFLLSTNQLPPCLWDVFTPISLRLDAKKKLILQQNGQQLNAWICFAWIGEHNHFSHFLHWGFSGDVCVGFTFRNQIIQTQISFTGEQWSKTLHDIPSYLSLNSDPHFMADEIV